MGARDNYIKEGFTDYLSKPVMYEDLEAILLKYLDPKLISAEASMSAETEEESKEKPLVIAISESPDQLRSIKSILGSRCQGVFVKDVESASRYLSKNSGH